MKQIIVRNVPDGVHKALKMLAAETGESMNTIIVRLIFEAVRPKPTTDKKEGK